MYVHSKIYDIFYLDRKIRNIKHLKFLSGLKCGFEANSVHVFVDNKWQTKGLIDEDAHVRLFHWFPRRFNNGMSFNEIRDLLKQSFTKRDALEIRTLNPILSRELIYWLTINRTDELIDYIGWTPILDLVIFYPALGYSISREVYRRMKDKQYQNVQPHTSNDLIWFIVKYVECIKNRVITSNNDDSDRIFTESFTEITRLIISKKCVSIYRLNKYVSKLGCILYDYCRKYVIPWSDYLCKLSQPNDDTEPPYILASERMAELFRYLNTVGIDLSHSPELRLLTRELESKLKKGAAQIELYNAIVRKWGLNEEIRYQKTSIHPQIWYGLLQLLFALRTDEVLPDLKISVMGISVKEIIKMVILQGPEAIDLIPELLDYSTWFCTESKELLLNYHISSLPLKSPKIIEVCREKPLEKIDKFIAVLRDGIPLLQINFEGEDGHGEGTLREWIHLATKEIVSPELGLFYELTDGSLMPTPLSFQSSNDMSLYKLFGIIILLSVVFNIKLPVKLSDLFYYHLVTPNFSPSISHLEIIDFQFANSLSQFMELSREDIDDVEIYFEAIIKMVYPNEPVKLDTVELCDNGTQIKVTFENRSRYIRLLLREMINTQYLRQMKIIRSTYSKLLKRLKSWNLFEPNEVSSWIEGVEFISVDLWKKYTMYSGWSVSEGTVQVRERPPPPPTTPPSQSNNIRPRIRNNINNSNIRINISNSNQGGLVVRGRNIVVSQVNSRIRIEDLEETTNEEEDYTDDDMDEVDEDEMNEDEMNEDDQVEDEQVEDNEISSTDRNMVRDLVVFESSTEDMIQSRYRNQRRRVERPRDHKIVKMFWEILEESTANWRNKLFTFCTAYSCLPRDGFKGLPYPFTLSKGKTGHLPVATTCFCQLHISDHYDLKDELKNDLDLAMSSSTFTRR